MEAGREDLSVAKLAEAHWDAVAIMKEAGRAPQASAIYGVWASDIPGMHLHLDTTADGYELHGGKMFCSGAGLIDRALITVNAARTPVGGTLDLRANQHTLQIDNSTWITDAFSLTNTSVINFIASTLPRNAIIGEQDWYLDPPGLLARCLRARCLPGQGEPQGSWMLRSLVNGRILIRWRIWVRWTPSFGNSPVCWLLREMRLISSHWIRTPRK